MDQIKILVTSEYENERVDKVIASEADTLSRSFVQKIIKDQEVTVDGKVVKEMRVIGSKLPETVTIPLNYGSQLRIDVFSDVLLAKCGMANITVK